MRWVLPLLLLWAGLARAERFDTYQLLMWQDRTEVQLDGLRALGFTGAKVRATGGVVDEAGLLQVRGRLPSFYLENLATDFYSPYHRYAEGKPVTWLFDALKAQLRADPADIGVFVREPSLSDEVWLDRVRHRLIDVVRAGRGGALFYNLADESGIGDLAAAWDADVSAPSLAGMRAWLRTVYQDLAALNRQWGTAFAAWDDVAPELTDAALRRGDENFSAWCDFKAWMDVAFARAVRVGADAVHAADPAALAALEGGQVPGWGGYDYSLLAPAVDVMEIYDYGEAADLARAFHPGLVVLRTSFGRGPREVHDLWRSMLHGGRGSIVWDEADDVVRGDGQAGPRGVELQAVVGSMREVEAAVRQPVVAPVAVLVSQASFRVQWLLDRRVGDRDWAARDAEREYDDNAWRASRRVMVGRLSDLGVTPRYVAKLEGDALRGARVLLLPHAIALSPEEVAAVVGFRAGGGTVLADTEAGLFDEHGRRWNGPPPLRDVPHPRAVRVDGEETSPTLLDELAALLVDAGVPLPMTMLGPDGQRATGVEMRSYTSAEGLVVSLQATRAWGGPPSVLLRPAVPMIVTDLRQPGAVSDTSAPVMLDGIEPRILLLQAK